MCFCLVEFSLASQPSQAAAEVLTQSPLVEVWYYTGIALAWPRADLFQTQEHDAGIWGVRHSGGCTARIPLQADVLEPQVVMARDEAPQQLDALGIGQVDHLDTVVGQPIVPTREVLRLAHDHGADAELTDQPAAVPARRQRGDHHRVGIVPSPSGVAEGVGLAVHRGVVLFDAAVAASSEQGPVAVKESATDRDTPLAESDPGLFQRDLEEFPRLARRDRRAIICGHRCPPVRVGW